MNLREWALPVYTIMMQLAIGALFVLWTIRCFILRLDDKARIDNLLRRPVLVIFLSILIAIIGSHFHLSKPFQSFLAVMNFRTSWLSREIIFTIVLFFSSAALIDQIWEKGPRTRQRTTTILGWAVILLGFGSIYCMARIYLIPIQSPWNTPATIMMFFLSALVLGPTTAGALLVMDAVFAEPYEPDLVQLRQEILNKTFRWLVGMAAVAGLGIVLINVFEIWQMNAGSDIARTSLALLINLYKPLLGVRFLFLIAGLAFMVVTGILLVVKKKALRDLTSPVYLACLLILIAEILGRFLFYATHVRIGI